MTGTELEIKLYSGMSNMLLNETINQALQKKLEEVEPPKFSKDDTDFAREIARTIPPDSFEESAASYGLDAEAITAMKKMLLHEGVLPPFKSEIVQPGSTDVGDVSWATPTGQIVTTCMALGTPGHSWQTVAQSRMGIGHKGMLYAGKVLALAATEFMQKPELVRKAKEEYKKLREALAYVSPIPEGLEPPLNI